MPLLRRAGDIRAYVGGVRNRCAEEGGPTSIDNLQAWSAWALAQAERIDPVRSGRFVESMRDEEPSEATDAGGFELPIA